jgi:hypothetical protein
MEPITIVGWASSALIVWSLMQARVLRFRWMNLAGASLATVVNALLGIWPFAAMNLVITIIDVYWIWRLLRERHDERAYGVVEVGIDDAYLRHLLAVKRADLAATQPGFRAPEPGQPGGADRSAFLVLHGDETVGMVIVRDAGAGTGEIEVDYVTERFRDFTPGEFVFRQSGVFPAKGFERLVVANVPGARDYDYYSRIGFRPVDGYWERSVQEAAA